MGTGYFLAILFLVTAVSAIASAAWQVRRARQAKRNHEPASLEARRVQRKAAEQS